MNMQTIFLVITAGNSPNDSFFMTPVKEQWILLRLAAL